MIYKDPKLEINDQQLKFRNDTAVLFFILFISIFSFSILFTKGNFLMAMTSALGLAMAFLLHTLFSGLYFKSSIDLSAINYISVKKWDNSIDKKRNFWGKALFKYHFPTGINKKARPVVLLVHITNKDSAIGFVPKDLSQALETLNQKDIAILNSTDS
ncbi:MAG: hypothetical protein N4A71_07565 [Carboxylicivirga sp.]|jgi:hypothetical protein|nr:hypothetical protein [Carboxylicivirga sp.]